MADTATRPIVEDVSLKDLKAGLADGSIVLVDVREPHEFAAGHIPGSSLNPLQSFDPDALPPAEPGKRIVFSCRSGAAQSLHSASRSKPAATTFARIILVGFWDGKAQASGWRPSKTQYR